MVNWDILNVGLLSLIENKSPEYNTMSVVNWK